MKFEEIIYNERIKEWIRDKNNLKALIRFIDNIVCGQCLKLIQDKLTMKKDFNEVETNRGVTTLLNEVQPINLQIETNTSVYNSLDQTNSLYYTYKQE